MGNKQYSFGKTNQGDVVVRNKAQLDDGSIVEYDSCCLAGGDPGFSPEAHTKYLGRGTIYEVRGARQYETFGSRVEYLDFWRVYK
jgi:hypothetical protein